MNSCCYVKIAYISYAQKFEANYNAKVIETMGLVQDYLLKQFFDEPEESNVINIHTHFLFTRILRFHRNLSIFRKLDFTLLYAGCLLLAIKYHSESEDDYIQHFNFYYNISYFNLIEISLLILLDYRLCDLDLMKILKDNQANIQKKPIIFSTDDLAAFDLEILNPPKSSARLSVSI